MSRVIYCVRQGLANLSKNKFFTFASILTIAACVFLFSVCCLIVVNVQAITYRTETMIGITVFFDEDATDADKEAFRDAVLQHGGVKEMVYTSAEEAWESFKEDYFGDEAEELSEAFADDNPLATSDSYEIFLDNISDQEEMVDFIRSFDTVREVNYLYSVTQALESLNKVIYFISAVIIGLLFVISIFLISNTIGLTAHMRRHENEIMRLIGATNGMIRAPFVIEGTLIGLIGALIPLIGIYFIYNKAGEMTLQYTAGGAAFGALADIVRLVEPGEIFPFLIVSGLVIGAGTGGVVSFMTIRKHLRV